MRFSVSLGVSSGLVTANAVFSGSGECNPMYLGLHVLMMKFVQEFISLNSSRK